MIRFIPYGVTRSVGRTILKTKMNSPHIFFGAGVAGMVGSTILACRATLRLDKSLDQIKNDIHAVKDSAEIAEISDTNGHKTYDQREYVKDLSRVYVVSAVRLGKLYGPSVLLGAVSIGALSGSHIQLTRRNSALTGTLVAVSKAFDEYRVRVQEEIGKEEEHDLFLGVTEEKNDKNKKVKVINTTGYSVYARIFDEMNPNWYKDVERNRNYLTCQQKYCNHLLRTRGHVMLNDVYDLLGFERSSAGAVVGWVYESEDGDGFIDFGLFEAAASQFINGLERSVILDFNVDGVVYDQIGG